MKILPRVLLGLLVLVLIAGIAGFFMFDSIVRGAVEKGGTYATGVPVTLEKADVGLFSGHLDLNGFAVANPKGFRDEPFVRAGSVHAAWQNGSVFSDTLVIDELTLDGIAINLERADGHTNFGQILDHISSLSGKDGKAPEPADTGGAQKSLVVKHVLIRDVKAAVHMSGLASGSAGVTVQKIELHDFKSDGTTSENVGKLTSAIVNAVLSSTLDAGSASLPKEILSDLKGSLAGLESQAKDLLKDFKRIDVNGLFPPKNPKK